MKISIENLLPFSPQKKIVRNRRVYDVKCAILKQAQNSQVSTGKRPCAQQICSKFTYGTLLPSTGKRPIISVANRMPDTCSLNNIMGRIKEKAYYHRSGIFFRSFETRIHFGNLHLGGQIWIGPTKWKSDHQFI